MSKLVLVFLLGAYSISQAKPPAAHSVETGTRGSGTKIAPEVLEVKKLLSFAKKNPATEKELFPPTGAFTGNCYQGMTTNHNEKEAKIAIDPKDPFGENAPSFLGSWIHGEIEDEFALKRTAFGEDRYVLTPGEGAADKGKDLVYSYYPDQLAWGRDDSETRYSGDALDIPKFTPIEFQQKVYSRFGKTEDGQDFIVSRFVQIGTATFTDAEGKKVTRTIRIEDFCLLKRH